VLAGACAAQAATREEDLAALRARIDALRGELEGREAARREARDALRDSERAISDATRELQKQADEARAAADALGRLARDRDAQEAALEAGRAALGRLLAARAMAGAPDALRVALSGEDPAEGARRLYYLAYVSRAAAQMVEAHRAGLGELARLREASSAKAAELATVEARSRAERERLLAQRRERIRVLERVAADIRKANRELKVLAADEARLSRLVEEIGKVLAARPGAGYARVERVPEAGGAAGGPFSSLKGKLRLPVRGELSLRFGAPRPAGAGRSSGVFIRAAEGEPVRAVAAGRVVYAEWMRGLGNLLILDHGETYFSVYANNEALLKQTGDSVGAGESIATVGASGGNEQTGLYFELRHLGKAFDPLGWARLR
jgi:septal ring factor EnvC (AmiA/AmiB activator)